VNLLPGLRVLQVRELWNKNHEATMVKSLAAIATAALVASAIAGVPQFIEPVSATSSAGVAKIAAPACPDRGWPYRNCGSGIRTIRLDSLH
jgi:hypothetical protein